MSDLSPQVIAVADQAAAMADDALVAMLDAYRILRDEHGETIADFALLRRLDEEPWTRRKVAIALVAALRQLSAGEPR